MVDNRRVFSGEEIESMMGCDKVVVYLPGGTRLALSPKDVDGAVRGEDGWVKPKGSPGRFTGNVEFYPKVEWVQHVSQDVQLNLNESMINTEHANDIHPDCKEMAARPQGLDGNRLHAATVPPPTASVGEFRDTYARSEEPSDASGPDLNGHSVPGGFAKQIVDLVTSRGNAYGTPSDNHQLTAELLSLWFSRRLGKMIEISAEDVCMINVLQKAARLATVSKDDSWLDIAGYTENVALLKESQRNR